MGMFLLVLCKTRRLVAEVRCEQMQTSFKGSYNQVDDGGQRQRLTTAMLVKITELFQMLSWVFSLSVKSTWESHIF